MGDVIAVLIVFAVFAGIATVVGVVAVSILLANGKFTLPGTNMRAVQHARAQLEITRMAVEREQLQTQLEAQIELRYGRAVGHRSILVEGEGDGN